jgi:hypothetical protein
MKRFVIMTIIKMCGKAVLLTIIVVIAIGVIGNLNKWDNSISYSNAFFIAGILVIVAGGMSRLAAGQQWNSYLLPQTESFRQMSSSERANFIVNVSSTFSLVILGVLTGIMLILISVFVTKIF